jgi:hypothetical protein
MFPETRAAPVLLAQAPLDRTPSHGTGYGRYSPSFRERGFSETELPAYNLPA